MATTTPSAPAITPKDPQQVLDIIPKNELKFIGPFDTQVTSKILLTNLTDNLIQFKLKTTVPRRYCVRPNSGYIAPKAWVEVLVGLQQHPLSGTEKNKHKFMVQSVVEPYNGTLFAYTEQEWKAVDPERIMNHKLKCVFEMPATGNQANEQEAIPDAAFLKNNEKAKKVIDNKAAPKVPLPGISGELQKAAAEVKQLRDEESKLRQENLFLKEENVQLRIKLSNENVKHSYSPPTNESSSFVELPMVQTIGGAILIAIISFIIGKFVF